MGNTEMSDGMNRRSAIMAAIGAASSAVGFRTTPVIETRQIPLADWYRFFIGKGCLSTNDARRLSYWAPKWPRWEPIGPIYTYKGSMFRQARCIDTGETVWPPKIQNELDICEATMPKRDGSRWTVDDLVNMPRGS